MFKPRYLYVAMSSDGEEPVFAFEGKEMADELNEDEGSPYWKQVFKVPMVSVIGGELPCGATSEGA